LVFFAPPAVQFPSTKKVRSSHPGDFSLFQGTLVSFVFVTCNCCAALPDPFVFAFKSYSRIATAVGDYQLARRASWDPPPLVFVFVS